MNDKAKYLKAKRAYYEHQPIMTDAQFDKLEDKIRKDDPSWPELARTGVKPRSATVLHEFMPSLSKVYPADVEDRLVFRNWLVMEKLDGTSLQLVYDRGLPVELITRGDGRSGKNVSHLLPGLRLPRIADKKRRVIRCEALFTRRAFGKYSQTYDNARNLVNGVFNRKELSPELKDVHLVVLGVYGMTIVDGLKWATDQGLRAVSKTVMVKSDSKVLQSLLGTRKVRSLYECDGLVVADPKWVMDYDSTDKPKSVLAFKDNQVQDMATTTVTAIHWRVSARGRVVPKIEIKPVRIDGTTVKFVAAHNPALMKQQGLGVGSKIKIIRSGGVIPKVEHVVTVGKFVKPNVPFKVVGKNYVVNGAHEDQATFKIRHAAATLGIDHLGIKTIVKAKDVKLVTVQDYLVAAARSQLGPRLARVVGSAMATKIAQEFETALTNVDQSVLADALQIFPPGVGTRRLNNLRQHGLNLKKLASVLKTNPGRILEIKSWSAKSLAWLTGSLTELEKALKLWDDLGITIRWSAPTKVKGDLSGQIVTFTGYRDAQHERALVARGATVDKWSTKTTILIVKGDRSSSKVKQAQARGIRICSFEEC